MGDELTYYGALRILGKPKSRLMTVLDAVASVGLGAWATAALASGKAADVPLSLVELKNDVVGFSHEIVRRVSEWRSGLSRFERSQRLAAAHAVLVVSSFFEALEQAGLPVPVERLGLTDKEKAALATGRSLPGSYVAMLDLLVRESVPLPEPHRSSVDISDELVNFYEQLSYNLRSFAHGLAVWEELDDAPRRQLDEAVADLPKAALARYHDGFRNLAADNHEFEVWANLTEQRAQGASLKGLSLLLAEMAVRQPGPRSRNHLTMAYQAGLNEPIVGSGQAPDGVVLPSLGEGYVRPDCRVAEVRQGDTPSARDWWAERHLLEDVDAFLAGYLTSLRAVRAPMVVLGEPGSGKSTFMQVLAARLAEQDFLPVLVPLRDVTAESMVQEQIEQAIYQGPGDRVNWPELVEAGGGALPVVLLDGFDELIQAAAISRFDYLEQVKDFQRRQAQIGRPVAVIVTSRTVVADRTRFPAESLALQLQPFTEQQIRRWLEIWERHNAAGLSARGLGPLSTGTALAHRELAEQPLLLLMLAIFDAAGNGLQRADARIGQADLYERLLTEFARREIGKSGSSRALSEERQLELAERELQRLAVVALAMFARDRQSASDAELNRDLPILFPGEGLPGGEDASLTMAQRATGRFFFVHKSEAWRRDDRTRSYEFLHATFGEFLVARLTVNALRDLGALRVVMQRGATASGPLDDGFLHAVLSFSCLTTRTPIVAFLDELLQQMPDEERAQCRAMLAELIAGSLFPHPSRSFQDYEPVRCSIPRRLGVYSANLVVLLILIAGEVRAEEFCGPETGEKWEQYGYLWRSVFKAAEWTGFTDAIRVRTSRPSGSLEILLSREDGSSVSPTDTLIITEKGTGYKHFDIYLNPIPGISYDASFPSTSLAGRVFRDVGFMPNWHNGLILLLAIPALRLLGGEARVRVGDNQFLPGYLLALMDYGRELPADVRSELYRSFMDTSAISNRELYDQFMLRFREDVRTLEIGLAIEIIRSAAIYAGSVAISVDVVNELWRRPDLGEYHESLLEIANYLRVRLNESELARLDSDLLAACDPPPVYYKA